MQKITPFLWYDKNAHDAAKLYVSAFKNSKIDKLSILSDTPSGDVEVVSAELMGAKFTLMGCPRRSDFTPAVSYIVACDTKEEVDAIWAKLSQGGAVLMQLGEYPFSQHYGWLNDKYGVSWQITLPGEPKMKHALTTSLLFVGAMCGKAEDAINLYRSIFRESSIGEILRYGKGEGPDREGTVKWASFTLEDQGFAVMDSALDHKFAFSEANSFLVRCESQEEIDHFWSKLAPSPEAGQCGWVTDRYGITWQVVPDILDTLLADKDKRKVARVVDAFVKMKKFVIEDLEKAYKG